MSTEAIMHPGINEGEGFRVPYQGELEYTCESISGTACWSSVSHQGASITIGRYLSPGRLIQINQDSHDLIGYVVWCKPTQETDTFLAGIRFIDKGIEVSFVMLSTMVQNMLLTRQANRLNQRNQQPLTVQ